MAEKLKMSDTVTQKLTEIVKQMGGGFVQIGFMENATYPDGTSVATAAYMNEFGHGGKFPAPARSFFRTMIAKKSPEWPATMAHLAKITNYDGPKVLALMGEQISGDLQQSIVDTNTPALSPTTLALRAKFGNQPQNIRAMDVVEAQRAAAQPGAKLATGTQAKPLVWTGHMLNSVTYEVRK